MGERYLEKCDCGSGLPGRQVKDGYGIFLFYGCAKCTKNKLTRFREDIMEKYQTDEPIDED